MPADALRPFPQNPNWQGGRRGTPQDGWMGQARGTPGMLGSLLGQSYGGMLGSGGSPYQAGVAQRPYQTAGFMGPRPGVAGNPYGLPGKRPQVMTAYQGQGAPGMRGRGY